MGGESGALANDLSERGGEGARARDVGGSRTDRALVSASRAVGHHRDAAPGEENAGAGWSADLVTADAHEVEAEAGEGHVQRGDGLGGIGMGEASAGVYELNEVCDRLDGANLGGHKGHGTDCEPTVPRRRCVVA